MTVEIDPKLTEGLPFEPKQQDAILGFAMLDKGFLAQIKDRVKPNWFVDGWTGRAYDAYVKFFDTFGHAPKSDDEFFLFEEVYVLPPLEKQKLKGAVVRARTETNNFSLDVLKASLTGWLQSRIYHQYVSQSATLFNNRKFGESKAILAKAVKELQDVSFEGKAPADFSNPRALVNQILELGKNALTLGHPLIDKMLAPDCEVGSLLPGDSTVFLAPTNIGKCHGKGTEIIDASGHIVKVEDIKVGDQLMGPDGLPRTVLSTTVGNGPLYRIKPKVGGKSWICNDAHVLSLKRAFGERHGEIINIPVSDYLTKSDDFKKDTKLWRAEFEFAEQDLAIPPYILGAWLGDGHSDRAALTTMDDEIAVEWEKWIRSHGDDVSVVGAGKAITMTAVRGGACSGLLRNTGVLANKHIPHEYLVSSRMQRLELLAGLIDTDGYSGSYFFEITQKNVRLANDIAYLGRSLGFKVSEKLVRKTDQNGTVGEYTRLNLMGKLDTIPVRLDRKKGVRAKKTATTTGFRVEYLGEGDYYGFTLNKDHLYCLSDFTVTHNTTAAITVLCSNLAAGKKVFFITHEGRKSDIMEKIWCCFLRCTKQEFRSLALSDNPAIIAQFTAIATILAKQLVYIDYQKPGTTVEEVVSIMRQHQQIIKNREGSGFDLIVNDYPAIIGTEDKTIVRERRMKDAYVYRYLTDYAGSEDMHGLFSIQTNREGSKKNKRVGEYANKKFLTALEDVQEAYEVTNSATNLLTLNQSPEDKIREIFTFLICKSRGSDTGIAIACKSNFRCARTHDAQLPATWFRGNESLEQLDSLLVEYANREVPFNYKELKNETFKS